MTTDRLNLEMFLRILTANRERALAELKKKNDALRAELALQTVKWGTTLYHRPTR